MRDLSFLERQSAEHGVAIIRYAKLVLDRPLPCLRVLTQTSLTLCFKDIADAFPLDEMLRRWPFSSTASI